MIENRPDPVADSGSGEGIIAADDTGLLRGEQLIAQAEIDEALEPSDDEIETDGRLESPKS